MRDTEIFDKSTANKFCLNIRTNSISSEVGILVMQAAEICEKIDALNDERFTNEMTDDYRLNLLCIKAALLKCGDEIIECNKKL